MRPTTKSALADQLRKHLTDIEMFRDMPGVFLPEDHDFPEFLVEEAVADCRYAGFPSIIKQTKALPETIIGGALESLLGTSEPKVAPETGPYTVKHAATLLGISPRLVYQLCNDGKLGCERHGRAIRISDEHIATYRNESERQPIKSGNFKHLD